MSLKEDISKIHDAMDEANAEFGDKGRLCIYCGSDALDCSGIVHESKCPVMLTRNFDSLVKQEIEQVEKELTKEE